VPDTDRLLNPDFIYLLLGIIFLAGAVVSTCTGKTYSGFGGWANRSKEPTQFWWAVAVLYVGSVFCIGKYLGSVWPEPIFHPESWLHFR
jgi:hypothetical protein